MSFVVVAGVSLSSSSSAHVHDRVGRDVGDDVVGETVGVIVKGASVAGTRSAEGCTVVGIIVGEMVIVAVGRKEGVGVGA